jgi:putative membrane protein
MASTDNESTRLRPALHLLHGLMMGLADSVPGISGGTVALIVGIYDKLLASVGEGFRAILSLLRLDWTGARRHLGSVHWLLVLPLGLGIVSAIIAAAGIVTELLDRYPSESRALFLGMVGASLAIPWSRLTTRTPRLLAAGAMAAVIAFVLSGLPPGTIAEPSTLQIFGTAMIAICAMILPGVSGAFLLVVFGMYEPTLDAVHERNLAYVATFAGGAILGLGSFSLVLTAALRRYHDLTMAVLIGLMLGSLRALWPWQTDDRGLLAPEDSTSALTAVVVAAVGFGIVWSLDRWGSREERRSRMEAKAGSNPTPG